MKSIVERFWDKVNKNGPLIWDGLGPCWNWQGALDKDLYGRFNMSSLGYSNSYPAHKAAWILSGYGLPDGLVLDHLCNYPPCVNPNHMALVTPATNNSKAHKGNKHWKRRKVERLKRGEV